MKTVDNYDFWSEVLDWSPIAINFVRIIVIVQRGKDLDLRTESEYWEVQECKKAGLVWDQIITSFAVASKEEFLSTKKKVTTLCNAMGARAYLVPNKIYADLRSIQVPTEGGFEWPSVFYWKKGNKIFFPCNHHWEEKGWWYELDCDSPGNGGFTADWEAKKDEAIDTAKSLTTITELYEVPSRTGIHVYFRTEEPNFPNEEYQKVMEKECAFHLNPVANLYVPGKRYYLTTKRPAV